MDGGADGSGDGSRAWFFDNEGVVAHLDVKMAAGFGGMDFLDDVDDVVFHDHFVVKRPAHFVGLEEKVLDRFLVLLCPCLLPVKGHAQLVLELEVGRLGARAPGRVVSKRISSGLLRRSVMQRSGMQGSCGG